MNGDLTPQQSQSNAKHCSLDDAEDTLTTWGQGQAEDLGKAWADVRIDHIYASPFIRARDTALALARHNKTHPKIIESTKLKEQDLGPVVAQLMNKGRSDEAFLQRTGQERSSFKSGLGHHRFHCPPFGESLDDTTLRGISAVLEIVNTHGVELSTPPKEMSIRPSQAQQLVDGLPHIVIVSHNIFLAELYEGILSWKKPKHKEGLTKYNNTSWSRHIFRVKALEGEEDSQGCYQKKFGVDLECHDMKSPGESFID